MPVLRLAHGDVTHAEDRVDREQPPQTADETEEPFYRAWAKSEDSQEKLSETLGLSPRGLQLILAGERCPNGVTSSVLLARLNDTDVLALVAAIRKKLASTALVFLACLTITEGWQSLSGSLCAGQN